MHKKHTFSKEIYGRTTLFFERVATPHQRTRPCGFYSRSVLVWHFAPSFGYATIQDYRAVASGLRYVHLYRQTRQVKQRGSPSGRYSLGHTSEEFSKEDFSEVAKEIISTFHEEFAMANDKVDMLKLAERLTGVEANAFDLNIVGILCTSGIPITRTHGLTQWVTQTEDVIPINVPYVNPLDRGNGSMVSVVKLPKTGRPLRQTVDECQKAHSSKLGSAQHLLGLADEISRGRYCVGLRDCVAVDQIYSIQGRDVVLALRFSVDQRRWPLNNPFAHFLNVQVHAKYLDESQDNDLSLLVRGYGL